MLKRHKMPVYQLTEKILFPNPELAEPDGLLAIGGDLSPERLVNAYANGIFPWYNEGHPILWWSPDPRMVLFPDKFKRHKTLKKDVISNKFDVSFDKMFTQVITKCASVPRPGQDGDTWITDDMVDAYVRLHEMGIAHSVEVCHNDKLVGGLYGLSLGTVFFGESMFHTVSNASKVALWQLVEKLTTWDFDLIDVQQETDHLKSLGASGIKRKEFLHLLSVSIKKKSRIGNWEM